MILTCATVAISAPCDSVRLAAPDLRLSDTTRDPSSRGAAEPAATHGAFTTPPAAGRGRPLPTRRRAGKHADAGHDLTVRGGLAALSLDALSSVAYGPQAMILVLVAGGTAALHDTVPLTLVITGMLALLVVSYT
jgi:hypothetical protein